MLKTIIIDFRQNEFPSESTVLEELTILILFSYYRERQEWR